MDSSSACQASSPRKVKSFQNIAIRKELSSQVLRKRAPKDQDKQIDEGYPTGRALQQIVCWIHKLRICKKIYSFNQLEKCD